MRKINEKMRVVSFTFGVLFIVFLFLSGSLSAVVPDGEEERSKEDRSGFKDETNWSAFNAGNIGGLSTLGYFGAVFDGRYVYYVPDGYPGDFHGRVLRYDTQGDFTNVLSWESYNASETDGLDTRGYANGVFDGRYVYYVPFCNNTSRHARVLRYDTQGAFSISGSWSVYDAHETDGIKAVGFNGAIFDGRYVYFVPFGYEPMGHGRVLRYDTQGNFQNEDSWDMYDAGYTDTLNTKGYYGAVFDTRYIYFVPFHTGTVFHGRVLRYDTQGTFTNDASWSAYDANGTNGMITVGYKGGTYDGRYVYFAPFREPSTRHARVLRYDTQGGFTSEGSWTAVDAGPTDDLDAKGYIGAEFIDPYVYFIPYQEAQSIYHAKVLRYDTRGEFTEPGNWSGFNANNIGGLNTKGFKYSVSDGRYIYFVPYATGNALRYDTGGTTGMGYQIGHTSVTFYDGSRSREIPTEIFYPADISGDDVPLAGSGGDFPIVSFGHGRGESWDTNENIWTALVPEGYIVALPKTEAGNQPNHANFGADLAFLVDKLQGEGSNSSSIFYEKVGETSVVMGHSMGGAASFIAAYGNDVITAISTLAHGRTNPAPIDLAPDITIPALIFSGTDDNMTPPEEYQIPDYHALDSHCKTHINIIGGSHCQFIEPNDNCDNWEAQYPQPGITREEQHAITEQFLIPWLDYVLKNNSSAGEEFENLLLTSDAIEYLQDCDSLAPKNSLPIIIDPTSPVTTVMEDEMYCVSYSASDEENDTLMWSLSTNALFLSMNTAAGLLSGTPLQEDVGSYWVNVTVSDGEGIDSSNFSLEVIEVNEKPVIVTMDSLTAFEDVDYSVSYYAVDEENDTLTWSLHTNASFLTIGSSTGILSGIPRHEDVGTYWVNVTVSDDELMDSHNYSLEVIEVNEKIAIVTKDNPTAFVDVDYSVSYYAVDEENDTLTWSLHTNASFLTIGSSTGILSGTPHPEDVGTYWVNITVSDGEFIDFSNFSLRVIGVNNPPTAPGIIVSEGILVEGEIIIFNTLGSTDVDGDVLEYMWDFGDGNSTEWSIDISVEHNYSYPGDFDVILHVRDGRGGTNSSTATITVLEREMDPMPSDDDNDDNDDNNENDDRDEKESDEDKSLDTGRIILIMGILFVVLIVICVVVFFIRGKKRKMAPADDTGDDDDYNDDDDDDIEQVEEHWEEGNEGGPLTEAQ